MLEEFAQQQRHNQARQRQGDDLQTHLEAEACPAEPAVPALQVSFRGESASRYRRRGPRADSNQTRTLFDCVSGF